MPLAIVLLIALGLAGGPTGAVSLWPMPSLATRGSHTLYLSTNFEFRMDGSKYTDASEILKDVVWRTLDVIRVSHAADGRPPSSGVVAGVHVVVASPGNLLSYGVDESYKLLVPATGNPNYARI